MKNFLFEGEDLTERDIRDNLEAENCGVEESHTFVKPLTEDELEEVERDHIEKSKQLNALENKIKALIEPLNAERKVLRKDVKELITVLTAGGPEVTEKVYLFPDYTQRIMLMYDERARLVGTRPMNRSERQLHINSLSHLRDVEIIDETESKKKTKKPA